MKFRTQYDNYESTFRMFSTINVEPSLTEQAHENDANINVIMARYERTGQMPKLTATPEYGDFSQVPDYRTALDMIRDRQATFGTLPAKVRERFSNDPAKFIDFVTNPENTDELYTMGLAIRPEKPDTPPADKPPNGEPKP